MKTIYTCFCSDTIHEGHLNIIAEALKYGKVIVGALTDEALVRYNQVFPTITLEERINLYKSIEGVSEVVIQDDMMYDKIIAEIKPDYVIHGDNWKTGPMATIRENAQKALEAYGGEVIDIPYTYNENVKK